jgi:hypothetical protein
LDGGGETTVHIDFTASVQGSAVTLAQTCSSDQVDYSMTRTFTVSGNQLTFQRSVNGLTLVSTFNRQ